MVGSENTALWLDSHANSFDPPSRTALSPERRKAGHNTMRARIKVVLKDGVLDPQGKAIEGALASLGFDGVDDVRQGKYIEIDLTETDPAAARARVTDMCEKLLANTVIEQYEIELDSPTT